MGTTTSEALEKALLSFKRYYNIVRDDVTEPFAAEAIFHSHDEQYFLMKSAKLFESDSHEYVFFATEEHLTAERLAELEERAWSVGMSRVHATESHKSSDVTLVIIADVIDPDAAQSIPRLRHYKSYCFTLHGWSHFRIVATELSSGNVLYNRQGAHLKKLFSR